MMDFINQFSEFLLYLLLIFHDFTGNLGVDLIIFTILVRTALLPLTIPSLKAGQKMRELQPEIKKLQKKYVDNKQALQKAQVELYRRYNVNPLAGCLPQIIQLAILILLYRVLIDFLGNPQYNGVLIDPTFLWLNLSQPDGLYILPVIAASVQMVLSLMIAPGAETPDIVPNDSKKKKVQEENKKEEDFASMAQTMQTQMLYIMPVMTGIIAMTFPSGLALYWIITTIFSVGQQYYVSGWGGLVQYSQRALAYVGVATSSQDVRAIVSTSVATSQKKSTKKSKKNNTK